MIISQATDNSGQDSVSQIINLAKKIDKAEDYHHRHRMQQDLFKRIVSLDPIMQSNLRKEIAKLINLNLSEYDKILRAEKEKIKDETSREDFEPFVIEDHEIYEVKEGGERNKLTNFLATIEEEKILIDGNEDKRFFVISGKAHDGSGFEKITISAKDFTKMDWPIERWGKKAIIYSGYRCKEKVSVFIQLESPDRPPKEVYIHTGWIEVDGQKGFLTKSGALGLENINVELQDTLVHYDLPKDPQNIREALLLSLEFLNLGPGEITYLLLASIVAASLKPFIEGNFVVWLEGDTGTFKTTISSLAINHFGKGFSTTCVPANFLSTPNYLEKLMYLSKDIPLLIDDYSPDTNPKSMRWLESMAKRLTRQIGNQSARGRMTPNIELRDSFPPRCISIVTGEDLPSGQSTLARMIIINVEKGEIDVDKLTHLQEQKEKLPHAMSGFIYWVIDNWEDIEWDIKQHQKIFRQEMRLEESHNRLPDSFSDLLISLRIYLNYCLEMGAIRQEEYERLFSDGKRAIKDVARKQADYMKHEDPITMIFNGIHSCLMKGQAKLINIDGAQSDYNDPLFNDNQGEFIGFYKSKDYIFIHPGSTYNLLSSYYRKEGHVLPFKRESMGRILDERGYLELEEEGRKTVRRTHKGTTYRLLKIKRELFNDWMDS